MSKQTDELAALKKEVEALKAKVDPPKSTFVPMSDAEWVDKMHQMRERQANAWMPPSAIQEMVAAEPKGFMQGVVQDNRAPTGRPGMIPDSQQLTSPRPSAGDGTGWAREIPLGPSMHQRYVDAQLDAQDAKDRAELVEREARLQAMEKLAEQNK